MPYVLYIASASAAVALFMMMPRRRYMPAKLGALLGAVTLGALWLYLAKHYLTDFGGDEGRGLARPAWPPSTCFSRRALKAGSAGSRVCGRSSTRFAVRLTPRDPLSRV